MRVNICLLQAFRTPTCCASSCRHCSPHTDSSESLGNCTPTRTGLHALRCGSPPGWPQRSNQAIQSKDSAEAPLICRSVMTCERSASVADFRDPSRDDFARLVSASSARNCIRASSSLRASIHAAASGCGPTNPQRAHVPSATASRAIGLAVRKAFFLRFTRASEL